MVAMEELLRSHLARSVAEFSAASGYSREKIADLALNDNTFFRRVLDERRGFTVRTYDRLTVWMASNWPPEADRPSGIPYLRAECADADLPKTARAHA